jgi:uncharacterized glyoxalase superfamily protein PhnB
MLNVSNIEASLHFYDKALGFKLAVPEDRVKEWRWALIRSGDVDLMLSESGCELTLAADVNPHQDNSWPAVFYFYPDDVVQLHQHLVDHDYDSCPLEVTFYGMKEFSIQDPDGHMLSFGQDADTLK